MAIANNHSQDEIPLEQLTALGAGQGPSRLDRDTIAQQGMMAPQQQMAPAAQMAQAVPMQQQAVSPLAQPIVPPEQQQAAPQQQPQQQQEEQKEKEAKLDLPNNFQLPYTGQQGPQPLQEAPPTTRRDRAIGNVAYTKDGVRINDYNPSVPLNNQKNINVDMLNANPELLAKLIENPKLIDEVWDDISG
jgi:hypothetical protein